jgi:flagellar protein FlgJ
VIERADLSSTLATDVKGMAELRRVARENSPEALKATAKQFEALFMNMVLKSMREATPQDGIFDSQQSRMYTSMLDQQISQTMASRGVGLADVLIRQLSNTVGGMPPDGMAGTAGVPSAALPATSAPAATVSLPAPAEAIRPSAGQPAHVRNFLERLGSEAEQASRMTGIPARFMLGQAALESGWGRREIQGADGTPSHNLFGIKATGGWKGRVVETATTEYVNGVPETRIEKFRAYDSYADAFRDYARLLKNNPRYQDVIANAHDAAGFAQGLQRAGYATDPHYAAKLTRIINHSLSA